MVLSAGWGIAGMGAREKAELLFDDWGEGERSADLGTAGSGRGIAPTHFRRTVFGGRRER
jgi:hypothetical protein